jgi:methylmalonyl-CoA epimerase
MLGRRRRDRCIRKTDGHPPPRQGFQKLGRYHRSVTAPGPIDDPDRQASSFAQLARARAGDLPALARAISTVENGSSGAAELLTACRAAKLDHIGIAVRSIAAARISYASLGLAITHEEMVEHEQVRTAMLPLGETRLELLEPTAADSPVARFLSKRGEGLHHIALRTDDIDALFERLSAQGVKLASDCVRIGAGGHRYFFIHPESTGGVLLEIMGDQDISQRKAR